MAISNSNYICIDCRYSSRSNTFSGNQLYLFCNKELWCLGKRWRIPKKNDDKGWEELRQMKINNRRR